MTRFTRSLFTWLALLGLTLTQNNLFAETAPNYAAYSIVEDSDFLHFKRSVIVRLNEKVSKQTLRAIAVDLKKMTRKNYEKTFIAYYLPGMKIGAGAWATTHFEPNLKVLILGLTLEEEKALTQEPTSSSRDTIGAWIDHGQCGSTVTLYRENEKLYLKTKYYDGSGSTDEVIKKISASGTKLTEKNGNPHGEYFIIDKNGDLHAGDRDGLFLKYKKLR